MNNMSVTVDYKELFKSFSSVKIGVIGDMMLDTYWWGNVERISPEAPVPVVTVRQERISNRWCRKCGTESCFARNTCFRFFCYWEG